MDQVEAGRNMLFNEVRKSSERLKTVGYNLGDGDCQNCLRKVEKVMRNSSRTGRNTKVDVISDPLQP